ncbi:HAD family hydrolase [Patescibacteria group bacterium]
MSNKIKTIIFDLGGVIINSFGKELIDYVSKELIIEQSELRDLMDKYEPDLQIGKITHVEFWEDILKEKRLSASKEILSKLWLIPYRKYAHINQKMINLVNKLKNDDYIVGIISNAQEPHNSYNRERGLFKYFNICILSSEVGIRKPDMEIFKLYLEKAECKPEEAIFIDDEEKLLINANKLGIHTIHFQNIEQLKKELISLDILV